MGDNKVTIVTDKTDELRAFFRFTEDVLVGYPKQSTGPKKHHSGHTMATIAAFNELGHDAVPPRPFMRQGAMIARQRRGLLVPHLRRAIMGRFHGTKFMLTAGYFLKGAILTAVERQNFAPLHPLTIAMKGHDTILIDEGEMVANLDVVIDR